MRQYQPRRSSKRWLEGAPEYVLACYDNSGKTADRYTVLIGGSLRCTEMQSREVEYLGMSGSPTSPQGFSQWGECQASDRSVHGKHVRWLDLPVNIRSHVIARCSEVSQC